MGGRKAANLRITTELKTSLAIFILVASLTCCMSPKGSAQKPETAPRATKTPVDTGAPPSSDPPARTAPTEVASIDCGKDRLTGAQRETCASPALIQQTAEIDQLTLRLEMQLTGRDRQILLDTEGPFIVERNNCQNARPAVRECVERVLGQRSTGLTAALSSPSSIVEEISKYTFLGPQFFEKYGDQLVGHRVHVFGCMVLEPGADAAKRTRGFISDGCTKSDGPFVLVLFDRMDETSAQFFDSKAPATHWEGMVERHDREVILTVSP
jgi:hypothetical protein